MSDKLPIRLSILERVYSLSIAVEDEEKIREAAKRTNEWAAKVRQASPKAEAQDLLAMVALQFASKNLDNEPRFGKNEVGDELEKYLTDKGFSVIHNKTMHDYPSYTGSYDRSLVTVQNLLYEKNTDIVIDLHRDAVGDGTTYGPKVKIDGEEVAQLMFVIGTNGSGLDHPNWNDNLKIAIKIQAKANQMYPRII